MLKRLGGFRLIPPKLDVERKREIAAAIGDGSSPEAKFWVLLALSTTIAAYGLLLNSTAVVIGAMIIAPLMGPILGTALALVDGDRDLLLKALFAEVNGVALVIGISCLIGLAPFNLGISEEMIARTSPTMYDLMVAVAAGLAGAYATVQPRISVALPGVAIAVALVPPLATCGLMLALAHYRDAFGAFLLFLANFLAIQLAASAVFLLYDLGHGVLPKTETLRGAFRRFLPSMAALVLVGWFMTNTLIDIHTRRVFEQAVTAVLRREFSSRTGGFLDEIAELRRNADGYEVVAVALTPKPFEQEHVRRIEEQIEKEADSPVHLIVRSVVSKDIDREGQVFLTREERERRSLEARQTEELNAATSVLSKHLNGMDGARLENVYLSGSEDLRLATAIVNVPEPLGPKQVNLMQQELAEKLEVPVRLVVRSVLTRDADADRFLYESVAEEPPKREEGEVKLLERLQEAIPSQFRELEGFVLQELKLQREGEVIRIQAKTSAARIITPAEVAAAETNLRRYVDPRLRLRVSSRVEAEATATGWSNRS